MGQGSPVVATIPSSHGNNNVKKSKSLNNQVSKQQRLNHQHLSAMNGSQANVGHKSSQQMRAPSARHR